MEIMLMLDKLKHNIQYSTGLIKLSNNYKPNKSNINPKVK